MTATLADGNRVVKSIYDDLTLEVLGRAGIFRCVDNGTEAPLLLGQIVFEQLDLIVDCANQKVCPNPDAPEGMLSYEMF